MIRVTGLMTGRSGFKDGSRKHVFRLPCRTTLGTARDSAALTLFCLGATESPIFGDVSTKRLLSAMGCGHEEPSLMEAGWLGLGRFWDQLFAWCDRGVQLVGSRLYRLFAWRSANGRGGESLAIPSSETLELRQMPATLNGIVQFLDANDPQRSDRNCSRS